MSTGHRPPWNLVDSSGWIEYFTESPNAGFFAPAIEDVDSSLVASLCFLEVFKWILREKGERAALKAVARMQEGQIVDLDANLAIRAAKLGTEFRLPLADSVILGTARAHDAVLWTQDSDFENVPDVRYIPKRRE